MKEHPLLFKPDMVLASLNTKPRKFPPEPIDPKKPCKGMTRRLVSSRNSIIATHEGKKVAWDRLDLAKAEVFKLLNGFKVPDIEKPDTQYLVLPRIVQGNRIWGRESWCPVIKAGPVVFVAYRSDGEQPNTETAKEVFFDLDQHDQLEQAQRFMKKGHWVPSIHMPMWACRLVFHVISTKPERLQDITEKDIIKEGLPPQSHYRVPGGPTKWFQTLWDNTCGDWDHNPPVWVHSYARLTDHHGNDEEESW